MIDKHRRHYVYDTVFQFIIDNNLKVFPISVQKLCSLLNTELVTLSDIVRHSNLRIKDVLIFGEMKTVVSWLMNITEHYIIK